MSEMLSYALVLAVGFVAGIVSGMVGTGATVILLPVLVFALAAWLYRRFDGTVAGLQFETRLPWIRDWGVGYRIGLDGLNVLLVSLTAFLGPLAERFLVFCDDLSFEDGEAGYKALKSILDGSVSAASANVLIYATSNRRHLLPEYMKENLSYTHTPDGEVHPGEVVEEKISLSERFGLWVSFYPFSQDEYLTIVAQWLASFGVSGAATAAARPEALVWALERGSRSGRVAYQFARDYAGKHSG